MKHIVGSMMMGALLGLGGVNATCLAQNEINQRQQIQQQPDPGEGVENGSLSPGETSLSGEAREATRFNHEVKDLERKDQRRRRSTAQERRPDQSPAESREPSGSIQPKRA